MRLARRVLPGDLLPEIVIHGRHSRSWTAALGQDAPVWQHLRADHVGQPARETPSWLRKRVVVPLMEPHILSMPGGCHALVPDPRAVSILADKARFAEYAAALNLSQFLPQSVDLARPTFPAVLKRTNLNTGIGVALVASPRDLVARLATAPWLGEPVLLQEAIPGRREFVTHVVCVRGQIVWHRSYAYRLPRGVALRGAAAGPITAKRWRTDPDDIRAFEALLKPLAYDGPANIDYRRRPDGTLVIFEINPRLGGSLMRPGHARDLAGALRAIVRHARWRSVSVAADALEPGEVRA